MAPSAASGASRREFIATGAIAAAAEVTTAARALGLPVRGYISMCFGDPWEGSVPVERVADIAKTLIDSGVTSLSLGDTIGVATPRQVDEVLALLPDIVENAVESASLQQSIEATAVATDDAAKALACSIVSRRAPNERLLAEWHSRAIDGASELVIGLFRAGAEKL